MSKEVTNTDNILTITFIREKETKNTIRFQEVAGDSPPMIGTLYIQKWACRKLGVESTIVVALTVPGAQIETANDLVGPSTTK